MRDFLAAWSAPTAESLHVSRPASLSWGLQVRGRWRGDTLRGRAVAHTDVVRPEFDPRANVLAVLYRCADRQAARVASQALDAFMAADRVDSRQNQREILFLQTRFDRHIPQP